MDDREENFTPVLKSADKKVRLLPDTGEPNSTIFALGATGCGKTTLIANLLDTEPRFVIFDTKRDFSPQFFDGNLCVVSDYHGFVVACNQGELKIIFDMSGTPIEEQEAILNSSLIFLLEFQVANKKNFPPITVVIDELERFVESQETCRGLEEIINRGRGPRIKKIFGSQWFGTVPTWVRNSFSEMYVFRHTDGSGLSRLQNYGFDSEIVRNLSAYSCLHGNAKGITLYTLVPDNKQTTQ